MKTSASRPVLALLAAFAALSSSFAPLASAQTTVNSAVAATPAADFPTALAELRKAVDERLAAINAGTEVPHRFDWTALDGQFEELSTQLRSLSAQEAKNRLRNLANTLKSEEAKALVSRLGAALDAELAAAETARQTALEKKFAAISQAALAAKNVSELDPLFSQLEELQQEINEQRGPRQSRNHNLLNRQQNFLGTWQNLLAAAVEGDRQGIRNAESNLHNGYARPVGVERSAIRARVRELSAVALAGENEEKVLLDTLTLDTLGEAQSRLSALNENSGWNNFGNQRMQIIAVLDQLRSATLALESGDSEFALRQLNGFGQIIHGAQQSESLVPLQRLRAAWLERSLPALTGLKDVPARLGTEFPEPYLRRLVLAADAAGEHERAIAFARVLRRVEPRLAGPSAPLSPADDLAGAYEHFVAGRRLEAAGQGEEAAKSYRAAIVAGAPDRLAAVLAERLKALAPAAPARASG